MHNDESNFKNYLRKKTEQIEEKHNLDAKEDEGAGNANSSINSNNKSISSNQNKVIRVKESSSASHILIEKLLTCISNLYLNVRERLHLDFPPRCLDDLAFCHRHHYRAELPKAPIIAQVHSSRNALKNFQYALFINVTRDMCHRGEFPGNGIFTKVIELILSINYVTKQTYANTATFQQSYHKSVELFSMIVRIFPPCWRKMRTYYVGFLEYGIDFGKLSNKQVFDKSAKIFDILLDLLEEVLNKTECEHKERQKQTFNALPKRQQLERVFMALKLLLQILENDLAMWLLHHCNKTKEWIFCPENSPLIVLLCELTEYTRITRVAKRIFNIYSKAVAKDLCKKRLEILERFIALLMVASNTADMENTPMGVKYPFLGDPTRTLIKEFFKIFKAHVGENIPKYLDTVKLLRIPYVRYEFIDNLLIMFRFTSTEPLTPQKIAIDIAKKRWVNYKPATELANNNVDISREQYLQLLLDALRAYCEFHGSKTILQAVTGAKEIPPLTTSIDTVHRYPTHGSGILLLSKMTEDIRMLESKLKMTVRMSKPNVDLPLADIYIEEATILKYRSDLKFIVNLKTVLLKQNAAHSDVDFTDWLNFL